MKYRADVDGLRAVAVLPVLFFHTGWTVFSGGYVGVDVFFVISGFLITGILAEEIAGHRFSIVNFYERRIRRILPCLFVVILASGAAGALLLTPLDFADFTKSVVATVVFASNILFYRQSGYFDDQSAIKPLLHTWSLAVEEQFYIFFPILLWLIHRYARDRIFWVLSPLAALSLGASIWGAAHAPSFTFYLAPTRVWELFAGAFIALGALPRFQHPALRESLAWLGLALISGAVFAYSPETAFPGLAALAPVGGAVLLIQYGQSTKAGWLLSRRPIVFIGLISYSLYLWHWPIIVYAEYVRLERLSGWGTVAAIVASLALATLSWRYVERPFRAKGVVSRRSIFAGAGIAGLALVAVSLAGLRFDGWPQRFPDEVVRLERFVNAYNPRRAECHRDEDKPIPYEDSCRYGADVPPTYAVWGDSHAVELTYGLGELARRHGKSLLQLSYSGCPPAPGLDLAVRPKCREFNEGAARFLQGHPGIDTVFVASRYDNHERSEAFRDGIRRAVSGLLAAGKRVVLVYPIPIAEISIPHALARRAAAGDDPARFTIDEQSYLAHNTQGLKLLDSLEGANIVRVFPRARLCRDGRCIVYADGAPLYFDTQHLTINGAAYLMPLFEGLF